MQLRESQSIFAYNVAHLIIFIKSMGMSCTFAEAYRTPEQAELDAKSGAGIKDSLHCQRLAIDLNLFDASGTYLSVVTDEYKRVGAYWTHLNEHNRWGGDFKTRIDPNHFEMNCIK